jgi:selenide,water dikinase
MCDLPRMSDPNLILGLSSPDDAAVYKLSDDLAIIQTIDFFTPIVDDPYTFGQIAATNALSDVYAKGGKPLTAMNVVCFPIKAMDISILKDILRGGVDKVLEADALLVGGHSIDDKELKYGLSVTGTIHPKRLVTNAGAKVGDKLVLTKPLGTGIISTALKAKVADEGTAVIAARLMTTLNRKASELMQEVGVNACTDITGFGLLGHTFQVAENSQVGISLHSTSIPVLPMTEEYARQGLCPGGMDRNRQFYMPSILIDDNVPRYMQDILYDPQTSGGLLISVESAKAERLYQRLRETGIEDAAVIGEVIAEPKARVKVH